MYGGEKPLNEYVDEFLIPNAMSTKPHATVQINIAYYIRRLYPGFNRYQSCRYGCVRKNFAFRT